MPSTSAWLGAHDTSSDESQEAASPIDAPSLDPGSSVRNQGPTPFVEEHIPIQKGPQNFPEAYMRVDSVEEFEQKSPRAVRLGQC
eukprot:2102910-Karenia_brevis.AAC.1